MKVQFNLTTSSEDMDRFTGRESLLDLMRGFDGVELMQFEEDRRGIIPKERVTGLHMGYFPCWLDFWKGNEEALYKEFGTREVWERVYGGADRSVILNRFRKDLEWAHYYGAEYVVFHVSDATIEESFTCKYQHTDEEVIDAVIELINELLKEEDGKIAFLVENLWQPGLTFTRPEMTKRLLEGIRYPNKGIMLDTGHLLHTNTSLRTQEEGVAYIHHLLELHGELCSYIRGVHLNQSLTGEYCEETMKHPPQLGETYAERCTKMFFHAFAVDKHLPFTCEGVKELVERIAPEYLTFEFITDDNKQHREYLEAQMKSLGMITEKHYSYFCNRECEYFPCHKGADPETFNCIFCYCPLYVLGENCGGNYRYTENGRKDCSHCLIPHKKENYEKITSRYQEIVQVMEKNG